MMTSAKTIKKKSIFKGKKDIDDILDLSNEERCDQEINKTKQERPCLLPMSCNSISPIDCFQSLVNKQDKKDIQNIYFMCISFMLQTEQEVDIGGNSVHKISTNYIFREKTKKKEAKSRAKNEEDSFFYNMTFEMKYHITSECASNSYLQILPQEGLLSDIIDKILILDIANYSSNNFILAPKTVLGKIFFYF